MKRLMNLFLFLFLMFVEGCVLPHAALRCVYDVVEVGDGETRCPYPAADTSVDVADVVTPPDVVMEDAADVTQPDVVTPPDTIEPDVVMPPDVVPPDVIAMDVISPPDVVGEDVRPDTVMPDVMDVIAPPDVVMPPDVVIPPDVPVITHRIEVVCDPAATGPRPLVTNAVQRRTMQSCVLTARESDLFLHGVRIVTEGPAAAYDNVGYLVAGGTLVTGTLVGAVGGAVDVNGAPQTLRRDVPTRVDFSALLNRATGGPCDGALPSGMPIRMSLEGGYAIGSWGASYAGQLNIDVRTGGGTRVYAASARQTGTQFHLRNGYPEISSAPLASTALTSGSDRQLFCWNETASSFGTHSWRTTVLTLTADELPAGVIRFSSFSVTRGGVAIPGMTINTYDTSMMLDLGGIGMLDPVDTRAGAGMTFPYHIVITAPSEQSIAAGTSNTYCLRATIAVLDAPRARPVTITMAQDPMTTGSNSGTTASMSVMLGDNYVLGPYLVPDRSTVLPGYGIATDLASMTHRPGADGSPSSCDFFAHNPVGASISHTLTP